MVELQMDLLNDATAVVAELYKRAAAASTTPPSANADFGVKEIVQGFIAQHGLAKVLPARSQS